MFRVFLSVGITIQKEPLASVASLPSFVLCCIRFSLDLAVFWILYEDLQGLSHAVSYRGKEEKVRFQKRKQTLVERFFLFYYRKLTSLQNFDDR